MSKQEISVKLEKRTQIRKGLNNLKKAGKIPAVIHNHGQESIIVSGDFMELSKVYERAGKHHPVNVKVNNKEMLTIIKDVDLDPKRSILRHVVFGAIEQNEKVETEVAVVLEGEIPAKKGGLVINIQLDHVQIEAFPRDLPDSLTVNAESLIEVGDRIIVSDIKIPNGVKILIEAEHPIATVEEPRVQEVEEPEVETATEGEETAIEDKQESVDPSPEAKPEE